jgi:hypothetical protein
VAPAASAQGPAPITRRRVLYIAGYDPNPPAHRRDLLAREMLRAGAVDAFTSDVGPMLEGQPDAPARWIVQAQGERDGTAWQTHTEYLMPRWDDCVRGHLDRPMYERLADLFRTLADAIITGTAARYAWHSHVFFMFWLYAFLVALVALAIALGGGWALVAGLGPMAGVPAALVWAGLVYGLLVVMGQQTHLSHVMELWIFAHDWVKGRRPDIAARAEALSHLIGDLAARRDVDETVIVGHSFGTIVGLDALAQAVRRAPEAFHAGAPVAFLTLGALHGTVAAHPAGVRHRAAIETVSAFPGVFWVEMISRQDVLNFYKSGPLDFLTHPIDPNWPNPTVFRLNLRRVLRPETLRRFRRNFFRMHFQPIMANDLPFSYDYPLIVAGPASFAARFGLRWPREVPGGTSGAGGTRHRALPEA